MSEKITNLSFLNGAITFDIALDPDNLNESFMLEHFKHGFCYETDAADVMLRVVKAGDFCIDVGANIGYFTLLLSRLVGETGHVLAFEPGTNNLPQLKHNMAINKVANVTLIEKPAWNKREMLRFYLDADSSGSNAVWDPGKWPYNKKSQQHPESYEIEAVPIDDYAKLKAKLVKIDTEGAEQRILEGMESVLRHDKPPYIIAEFNPFGLNELGCSQASLRNYMLGHGYETFFIHGDGSLPSLVPKNTEITHQNGIVVLNAMFSTLEAVGEAWPRAPHP